MRILLDNCLDVRATQLFAGHDVIHARDLARQDLENGKLLAAAAASDFSVMVTVDKNLRYQQHLESLPLTVLELHVVRNRLPELLALSVHIDRALAHAAGFRFISVRTDGQIECLAARSQ